MWFLPTLINKALKQQEEVAIPPHIENQLDKELDDYVVSDFFAPRMEFFGICHMVVMCLSIKHLNLLNVSIEPYMYEINMIKTSYFPCMFNSNAVIRFTFFMSPAWKVRRGI